MRVTGGGRAGGRAGGRGRGRDGGGGKLNIARSGVKKITDTFFFFLFRSSVAFLPSILLTPRDLPLISSSAFLFLIFIVILYPLFLSPPGSLQFRFLHLSS